MRHIVSGASCSAGRTDSAADNTSAVTKEIITPLVTSSLRGYNMVKLRKEEREKERGPEIKTIYISKRSY